MQKNLEETPATAKNFLVVSVITPTTKDQLDQALRLERYFQMSDLRQSQSQRDDFMEGIFNHALRITGFHNGLKYPEPPLPEIGTRCQGSTGIPITGTSPDPAILWPSTHTPDW